MKNIKINKNGGVYYNGRSFDLTEKVEVAMKHRELCETHDNVTPHLLSKEARVSRGFALKVLVELKSGGLKDPKEIVKDRKERNKKTKCTVMLTIVGCDSQRDSGMW